MPSPCRQRRYHAVIRWATPSSRRHHAVITPSSGRYRADAVPLPLQALFVYLLGTTNLTKPTYDDDAIGQYRSWRRNEAHSITNYDAISDSSLASRVCAGVVVASSASISDDYAEISEYLKDSGTKGTFMAGLALIAWYCTVSKEMNATVNSYHITRSVPRGPITELIQVESTHDALLLRQSTTLTVTQSHGPLFPPGSPQH